MNEKLTPQQALEKAVEIAGGQTALAKLLPPKTKQQHVWNWINRLGACPQNKALLIETVLGKRVTKEQLRPDLYPNK